ncbi:MAG: GlsB/YeaQ/YmgE family stress response membrane protein [Bacteroidaceae bacterium]|nr:GlsB/YeaQ/YmgE family stress response membrane protein [Bacteroidaceae bacterium]
MVLEHYYRYRSSVVGGFVAGLFGIKSDNFIGSFIISVVGAIICLLLYNYLV